VSEEVRTLRMTCKLYLLVRRKVFHRKHVRFAIKPLSAATGPTPAPAKSLLRKANRVTPTNAFHGFHKFAVRRDLHIRIRPDQSRKPADRKSTRLNSSHVSISYAVFCLKKKKKNERLRHQGPHGQRPD